MIQIVWIQTVTLLLISTDYSTNVTVGIRTYRLVGERVKDKKKFELNGQTLEYIVLS